MSSPTLVTGAAGFAGSHLLDLLTASGADVIAWHRPGGSPPRGVSMLARERLASRASSALPVLIARPFNHVGPRQDPHFVASGFARRVADIEAGRWAPEIAVGNLDARRDLMDVRDTVRAYQL